MSHFLLSMATLFVAVLLVWRVRRDRAGVPETPVHETKLVGAVRGLFAFGAVVIVFGTMVTASGPYAGGEGTGDDVSRLTLFGYDTFQNVIAIHARLAGTFGLLAVVLWFVARRMGARDLRAPLTAVCLVVALAGLIGNLQYHQLDYPAWLVWLHVSVATLLWNSLCWTVLAAGRPVRAAVPGAAPPVPAEHPELVTSDT
jgi:cytochrome c oxidase assembly protein subunit 15